MAGDQTHGYDLVLEFAEHAYQELLSVLFDTDGFLFGTILGGLGIHLDPGLGFSVTVAFDRPSGLPAAAADVIDVHVLLGEGGATGSLRIVASVDVDRSSDVDLVRINLHDQLWLTEIHVAGHAIPGLNGLFAGFLRNNVRVLPILPVPVDRAATSAVAMKAADVHIVDDTSAADRDASAFMVTFGGGTAGTRAAFTQSFISGGGNGGIAIGFPWMCRVISPMIDTSLHLGGAFADCHLTRTVRIDDAEEVDLTELSITPDHGFLQVRARVRKTGFCYEATGTVGARIRIEVSGGHLVVQAHVDDPDVNVDIPWYCWIVGAVIGALLGGLLFGVIGAIVGAVLVPVITYIAQEVIEGTVNSVAQRVADALNAIAPSVDIPAVGFNLLFSDVFIDDVNIACRVQPVDTAPVRATGTVTVPSGRALDLDSGQVGPRDMAGADLVVEGGGLGGFTQAVCGARWARTGHTSFAGLTRSSVYGYAYAAPNPVGVTDMAQLDPFGLLSGDAFRETGRIYGVRTNEGRWAAVQAVEVTLQAIRFRYITWEKALASVRITGGFSCRPPQFGSFGDVVKPGAARFVASSLLPAAAGAAQGTTVVAGAPDSSVKVDPCSQLARAVQAMVPAAGARPVDPIRQAILAAPIEARRIGTWIGETVHVAHPTGRFDATTDGMGQGQVVRWQVDGTGLAGADGDVDLGGGVAAKYHLAGKSLVLTMTADHAVEMLLSVTVVDDAGQAVSSERCVRYEPECKGEGRLTPMWSEYQAAWLSHFGVAEVGKVKSDALTLG